MPEYFIQLIENISNTREAGISVYHLHKYTASTPNI